MTSLDSRFAVYCTPAGAWSVMLHHGAKRVAQIASFRTDEERARSLAADLNSTLVSHVERFAADQHRRSTAPTQQEP
jgi:hypothetical protein